MRYLPLLRPERVKSQPTASEFNWCAQMFADVQGLLRCPHFFPLERYSSVAVDVCRKEGTKLEKQKASTSLFNSTVFFQCKLEFCVYCTKIFL